MPQERSRVVELHRCSSRKASCRCTASPHHPPVPVPHPVPASVQHPGRGRSSAPSPAAEPRISSRTRPPTRSPNRARRLFARENLVAWCIVPFDSKKRGPEERAAMLERLGFKHFAYDWRAEHIPTFDAEMNVLAQKGHPARRLLGRPRRAESRVANHPRPAQTPRPENAPLGPARFRRRSRDRPRARTTGRRRRGEAPPARRRGRPRSAARSLSTTTAAGSASPKTRSRSSSD